MIRSDLTADTTRAVESYIRDVQVKMEAAALAATDRGRRAAVTAIRNATSGAGLGRLGNALTSDSDKSTGQGVHRKADGFSASGAIKIRSASRRSRGAIAAYLGIGAEIAPVRGRFLWIATDSIPRFAGKFRMTPALYVKNGFDKRIGPLVPGKSKSGRPILIVRNVGVGALGQARSAKSLTKSGRARKGQTARSFIVAFVSLPRTARTARVDAAAIIKAEAARLPGYFADAVAKGQMTMAAAVFPAFLQLGVANTDRAKSEFLAAVDSVTGEAKAKVGRFADDVQGLVDKALSGPRNGLGAIDLGTAEYRAAAEAQTARATAARSEANALALSARAEGNKTIEIRAAIAAAQALAAQEELAAQAARLQARAVIESQNELNKLAIATDRASGSVTGIASALERGATAGQRSANSSGAQRFAYQQLGQQIQDAGVQAQLGKNAFIIFGQQVPQAAFALSGLADSANKTERAVGKVASFLSGPWGAATFIAISVIGPFLAKLIETGGAIDAETKKLADNALQTEATRVAKERFGRTIEGVTAAILDQEDALKKQIKALQSAAEQALYQANVNLGAELRIRGVTQALLEQALAQERIQNVRSQAPGQRGENADFGTATAESARLQKALSDNAALITKARGSQAIAQSFADVERGKADADPAALIEKKYKALIEAARARATEENKTGAALERQVAAYEKQKKAEIDLLKNRSESSNRQFGREVDVGQATAIAKAAGFRVTDGKRTIVDQQRLYDTVRTAENPVALPSANAPHVRGNALDIGFGTGVDPASIRKAFEAEGVKLTKILKETGHYHIEFSTSGADKVQLEAEKAQRAAEQLAQFGQHAADTIQQINNRFNEQPKFIDGAVESTQKLDETIAELAKKQPPNFRQLIADAKLAESTIRDSIFRPIDDIAKASARNNAIQDLIVSGRDAEANALKEIFTQIDRIGTKDTLRAQIADAIAHGRKSEAALLQATLDNYDQQLGRIKEIAVADQAALEARQKALVVQNAYLDATRSVRGEVESILSGTGKISNLGATFAQLRGKLRTEQLFGDAFRNLDKYVKGNTGLDDATDKLVTESGRAGTAAGALADAFTDATSRINGAGSATTLGGSTGSLVALRGLTDLGAVANNAISAASILGGGRAANDNAPATESNDAIVVNGRKFAKGADGKLTYEGFAYKTAEVFTSKLKDLFTSSGINLSPKAGAIITGGFAGALAYGPAGGVIGALREIPGISKGLSKGLDKAFDGLGTGTAVSDIAGALGIKLSKGGAQAGGAAGSLLFGPVGGLIGSIAGGIIGKLFSSAKTGSAALGVTNYGAAGVIGTGGNNAAATSSANGLGGQVSSTINQIADQLGAKVGSFAVAIGQRNDSYRVSGSGNQSNTTSKKTGSDIIYSGKDPQAAVAAAVQNAIQDGVITGISAASQNILKSGQDINVAIQKATAIENIPKALKQLTDPVGAAVDTLNSQFSKLIGYLKEGGATADQYAQAQKLYDLQRATAIKQAADTLTSGLRGLYDSLTVGNSALSLRDRKEAALAKFNPLEARLNAGDTTVYADFATAANTLLDIERQLSGSQTGYFELASRIQAETGGQIDLQQKLADAATASDSPFNTAGVVSAVADQTSVLGAKLDAIIANQIAGYSAAGTGSTTFAYEARSASYF